ncbi:MAG: hypothetical protein ACI4XL_02890 [Bacillus sp. (in: firmicutes)]
MKNKFEDGGNMDTEMYSDKTEKDIHGSFLREGDPSDRKEIRDCKLRDFLPHD